MMNFVCVYRTGKIYTPEYVRRLAAMVEEHFPWNHTFTVLTDVPDQFLEWVDEECMLEQVRRVVRLGHAWPTYWSKVNLFDFGHVGFHGETVVYFDLDTIITRSLGWIRSFIVGKDSFVTIRDWLEPNYMNSSVMLWRGGDHRFIYDRFLVRSEAVMKEFKCYPEKWGDQAWIQTCLSAHGIQPTYLQDLFPNQFVSFKAHTVIERQNASVVCFHGNPRPHAVGWDPFKSLS